MLTIDLNKKHEKSLTTKNKMNINLTPHYCRGHLKHYGKNNPLFGKVSGMWWWQPFLRGQGTGFINKDYKIKY